MGFEWMGCGMGGRGGLAYDFLCILYDERKVHVWPSITTGCTLSGIDSQVAH